MPVSNFNALCAELCEVAGTPMPVLEQDSLGMTAFTLHLRDQAVSFMQHANRPGAAIAMISLGSVDDKDDLSTCRILMEANFLLIGESEQPCIGRSPATGEFVLHFTQKLDTASGVELFGMAQRMAGIAQGWRERLMLAQPA